MNRLTFLFLAPLLIIGHAYGQNSFDVRAPDAHPAEKSPTGIDGKQIYILCKNESSVRTLRLLRNAEGGKCRVTYTKAGVDNLVADAKSIAFCEKQFKGIESTLRNNNWKCRDISPAMVHTGTEGGVNEPEREHP